MYVFFRLIKMFVISSFAPPISFSDTVKTTMRVWPSDLDVNLHLNNGRYLTLMDIGRFDLLVRCKMFRKIIKKGWFPVVGNIDIKFFRSLKPFQKFSIHTKVSKFDQKWFYLEQEFYCKGELYSKAIVKGLFRTKQQTIPTEQFLAGLEISEDPKLQLLKEY